MKGTDAFSLVSNVREKPRMNQGFNSELSRNTAGIKVCDQHSGVTEAMSLAECWLVIL